MCRKCTFGSKESGFPLLWMLATYVSAFGSNLSTSPKKGNGEEVWECARATYRFLSYQGVDEKIQN